MEVVKNFLTVFVVVLLSPILAVIFVFGLLFIGINEAGAAIRRNYGPTKR